MITFVHFAQRFSTISGKWLFRLTSSFGLIFVVSVSGGCTPDAAFTLNSVYLHVQEKKSGPIDDGHVTDIRDTLFGLFGTPDDPFFPMLSEVDTSDVVDLQRIQLAAGAVGSDESGNGRGLYREHCAHCHGITGNGAGPTAAFLSPYPRDFRLGLFKFKSTPLGERPTDADLKRTLVNGIPGTAMPSFNLLSDPELDALVHYVKYLSIRGEVERELMDHLINLDEGERLVDTQLREDDFEQYAGQIDVVTEKVSYVVQKWARAPSSVTPIPPRPVAWEEEQEREQAIARGRELFFGTFACIKCHGESAIGDGETTNFDEWTKDWLGKQALPDEQVQELAAEFRRVGALPLRNIRPRNLREGVYRGGRRPIDIFRRARNGIEGTPMPQIAPSYPDEDVWAVVEYVRSLPYESISRPIRDMENVKEIR